MHLVNAFSKMRNLHVSLVTFLNFENHEYLDYQLILVEENLNHIFWTFFIKIFQITAVWRAILRLFILVEFTLQTLINFVFLY